MQDKIHVVEKTRTQHCYRLWKQYDFLQSEVSNKYRKFYPLTVFWYMSMEHH